MKRLGIILGVVLLTIHLKRGNLFIAFQSLGDASGFMYFAEDAQDHINGIMGDYVRLNEVKSLHAVSPLPGQFRLIHNGKIVDASSDGEYQYTSPEVSDRGVYRIEVHIQLAGDHLPWVYSNPIYVY